MYEGIRFVPCVSTPRRSARTRQSAMILAFSGETPLPVRIDWVNVLAVEWGIYIFS